MFAAGFAFGPNAGAQGTTVLDISVKSAIGQRLSYSTVEIASGVSRFTDESGRASVIISGNERVRVRIKHLGYAAVDTTVVLQPGRDRHGLVLTLNPVVFRIATVNVKSRTSCKVSSDSTSHIGRLVSELRKNAERELLLRNSYPFSYRLARKFEVGGNFSTGFRYDTVEFESGATLNYEPGQLVRSSPLAKGGATKVLLIPTLIDMAVDAFVRSHCFSYAGTETIGGRETYKIDFKPVPGIGTPDVAGSAYLDTETFVVRQAVFTLTNPMKVNPPVVGMEVTTTYREIVPGLSLVEHIKSVQQVTGSRNGRIEEQRLVDVKFVGERPGEQRQ